MPRSVLVVCAAWIVLAASTAHADRVDRQVKDLRGGDSYKVRLAAVLALSKSHDQRAVAALTDALDSDKDASIRRIAAIGLAKAVDSDTPSDALAGAVAALDHASKNDKDKDVREAATRSASTVAAIAKPKKATATKSTAAQTVFVNVENAHDSTKRAAATTASLTKVVRGAVKQKGYSVDWPGGTPTQQQLADSNALGIVVGATVKQIDITPKGNKTEVACTVAIRIAPWNGSDGAEAWEANRAASASGSAKAVTGSGDRAVAGGIRDCVEAVGQEITSRQVVPFIKRLASP
jgi:hypothetical protein